jgi:hypothetical protein
MPIDNPRLIFKDKRAYNLALKYNLPLYDRRCYMSNHKYIRLSDVKFIVTELWRNHFLYNSEAPILLDNYTYIRYRREILEDVSFA